MIIYSLKVINLLSIITKPDKYIEHIKGSPIEIDKFKIDSVTDEIDTESIAKNAKAELAMAYFHCCEKFIRMFEAQGKLSGCPRLEFSRLTI